MLQYGFRVMFYMKFAGSLNLAWKLDLAYLTYYVAKTRLIEPGNLTYCIQLLKLPRPLIDTVKLSLRLNESTIC